MSVDIPTVVLIGPPGAGKSTVGREVARRLDLPFTDSDDLIESEQGVTISEIFVEQGEAVFRALEADAVARSLQQPGVVAVGGGAPMTPSTADLLDGQPVVFLSVAIADAAGRVGFDGNRPLLAVNPRATWTRLMGERRATYERLATWTVDTAGRTVADVVADVIGLVRES
ncbi:shikimate kinase [Rudaeicoccus suwonensis]|uniref:Shikimate kinase n=1 Tax=Rudaeicoccus suwonensis TaxID=657409 RepID=A0A561EA85_9MICO|nr:shikimate kinase [Rudaeicoccus suwonensis]TWE12521.1 shikimate kinase [Rudaeicoccus suwonensis]